MGTVTGADAVLALQIAGVLSGGPVQIQGFATDEAFDIPAIKSAEVMMGVDGIMSSGFVYVPIVQTISLQADSLSNAIFDAWWTQQQSTRSTYLASSTIKTPAILMKYSLTGGVLTSYKPMSNVKRLLQPRTFEITYNGFAPAPSQ